MFYFSYLECDSTIENTFAVSLHPYKVFRVEGSDTEEFSYGLNYNTVINYS